MTVEFEAYNPKHRADDPNLLDSKIGMALATGVIVTEVTPLNEFLRAAMTAGAGIISKDPVVTGMAFGASTAIIESAAALFTAEAFDSRHGQKLATKVKDKLTKVGIPEDARTNTPIDFGVSLLGGSAVAIAVKHAQDPSRTKEQNRSFGLRMTLGTSAICGALGYAAAEGIANPGVETIGAAAVAIGGVGYFAGWAKNKLKSNEKKGAK